MYKLIEKDNYDLEANFQSIALPRHVYTYVINCRLTNHRAYLVVQILLVDFQEMVVLKDHKSSTIEMWIFRQVENDSKAHTVFHNYLKCGQGINLSKDIIMKLFIRFSLFNALIIRLFFINLKDVVIAIEKNFKRIKLSQTWTYDILTHNSLYAQNICKCPYVLFNQALEDAAYAGKRQIPMFRQLMPNKQIKLYYYLFRVIN